MKKTAKAASNRLLNYNQANWIDVESSESIFQLGFSMKSILIKIFILYAGFSTHQAIAGHVLPVFTGRYTSEYPKYIDQDNCGVLHPNYTDTNTDYMAIIKKQFDEIPIRYPYATRCNWDSRTIYKDIATPAEFVKTNNSIDWLEIIKNPTAPRAIKMVFPCYEYSSVKRIYMPASVYPIYECPKGSRMTYEHVGNRFVCSTTPNVCLADIIGRDLSTQGLGRLGHTGLTLFPKALALNVPDYVRTDPNLVLEVLTKEQEPLVINVHTLKSFQEADKYWGIAYGAVGMEFPMKMETAKNILLVGQGQQAFEPEYTILPIYHEGTQKAGDNAKFRCDTFAYFSYLKGAKHSLDWDWLAPYSLFKAFFIPREDVPIQNNQSWSNQVSNGQFPGNDQRKIDEFFYDFVKDNATRQDKMALLARKISEFNSSEKFRQLMQLLGFLKPYEYIPNLIMKYKSESAVDKKYEIISTIHDALLIKKDKPELAYNQNIIDGENFYIHLMKTESDPRLLNHAITGAYITVTKETYIVITDAISRLNALNDKKNYFNEKQLNMYTLRVILDSKDVQRWQMKIFLDKQITTEEKSITYRNLVFLFKMGVMPQDIDDTIKSTLKAFITENKSLDKSSDIFDEANKLAEYHYAITSLTSNSANERDKLLFDLINNEKDNLILAKYIYGISSLLNDNKTLEMLSKKQRDQITDRMHDTFVHVNNSEQFQLYTSIHGILN